MKQTDIGRESSSMVLTCAQAAIELGISPSQVRRWIQSGAPVVRERRPMLLDLAELQRWRQDRHADALVIMATAMLQAIRAEMVNGRSASQLLAIDDCKAARLMLAAYSRAYREMTGRPDDDVEVNQALAQLRRVAGMTV